MVFKFEKFLFSFIVILSVLFVGLNIMNKNEVLSTVSNGSSNETKLVNSDNYLKAGVIKMSLSSTKNVKILVNGEENFNYTLKDNIMTLAVSDKDVVEVDLRNFKEGTLDILILKVSDGLTNPPVSQKYQFSKGINKLFDVKMN
ncbi:hypothetical protein [Anaerofustis stercorihominis]|uniref:hypothetical protein n=1 Tax=Anaerofustis stercorihominis TaxID=214853 RepID=UPI00214CE365|nr:hypothetical protein [Anaerofustis stercorihominis]MCR2032790.1 hypothetical protein [Anaerofustis stercorihominis]